MRTSVARLCGSCIAATICALQAAETFDYGAFFRSVRVPEEFTLQLAAGAPELKFPMFACFDDAGRLYVAESSGNDLYAGLQKLTRDCRVLRFEDTDGDGRFERRTVFQDKVTFPMGLVWRDGKLYLADPPELVALTDGDGDGRADKREIVLSGFGHTDNGSLHGLTFGPDEMLYFTMGEPDGWKLPRGDGTFLEGVAGALFRCRPDGSQLEVISRGFENLVEVEFLPGGEIVGTDNWYQRPAGGLRDALVDCAPGGLYPYAPDRGTPLPRTGVVMPPVILLPAVAHSGLTRMRTGAFPPEWSGDLFVAEHNTRKIVRHVLREEGSTFASASFDFVAGEHPDFHPSDVLEDPDGSLLIVDTGGWYVEHCPTGRIRDSRAPGGIYRVRWNRARPVESDSASEARLRAIWALAARPGTEALDEIRSQLKGPADATVVRAAARALAMREDKNSAEELARLLSSPNAAIRRAAAEALGRCGSAAQAPQLVDALSAAADAFEEHACIASLLAVAEEPFARRLLRHESIRVRRAALHLLDQPPFSTLRFSDLVIPLGDEDSLRATALALLERRPGWAAEALPWLRGQLAGDFSAANTAALGSLLVAFQSDPAARQLISELIDPSGPAPRPTRAFLLKLLPSLSSRAPEAGWLAAVEAALADADLREAALVPAGAYRMPRFRPTLDRIAEDSTAPILHRFHAARASAQRPALSQSLFGVARKQIETELPTSERLAAEDLISRANLTASQLRELLEALRKYSMIQVEPFVPALIHSATDETRPALADFFASRLNSGWSPPRGVLDEIVTLFARDSNRRAEFIARWTKNNAENLERLRRLTPLLEGGDPARGRGVFISAGCFNCHRVGESGGVAGPDLSKIGAIRSGQDLLESIVFPSSTFAQGYEPYALTRKDGDEISGTLLSQDSNGIRIRESTGVVRHAHAADIRAFKRQEVSLMPAGTDEVLKPDEFRDLLAYLRNLK